MLSFVRRARTLGLRLNDIREVLAIRNGGVPPCAAVCERLDERVAELDSAINELLALRATLTRTRQRAINCTDEQPVTVCAIIEGADDT